MAPALCAVLILLVTLAACGGQDGASAAAGGSSGPRAFADESYAELATDGSTLWLAVTGYRRSGVFGLKVFEKSDSEWVQKVSPPGRVSGDLPVSLVIASTDDGQAAPCLGYSTGKKNTPVVACLEDDAWKKRVLPVPAGAGLIQIGTEDRTLNALVSDTRSSFRLLREVAGEWIVTPRLPRVEAVAQLAIEEQSGQASPAVGLATQRTNAEHRVYELRGEVWRRLEPSVEDVGVGPLVGGPVLVAGRVLYPVNQADSKPWSFSVQSAHVGSDQAKSVRLSTGGGNAQGQLDLADGRIWATWQEDAPLQDGRFRSAIFAAELSSSGRVKRKITLWRGLRIGPGSTQVVAYGDQTLALYMRSSDNGRGLQAAVEALPPAS